MGPSGRFLIGDSVDSARNRPAPPWRVWGAGLHGFGRFVPGRGRTGITQGAPAESGFHPRQRPRPLAKPPRHDRKGEEAEQEHRTDGRQRPKQSVRRRRERTEHPGKHQAGTNEKHGLKNADDHEGTNPHHAPPTPRQRAATQAHQPSGPTSSPAHQPTSPPAHQPHQSQHPEGTHNAPPALGPPTERAITHAQRPRES